MKDEINRAQVVVPAGRRTTDGRNFRKSSKNQTVVVEPTKFGATVLLLWGHSVHATILPLGTACEQDILIIAGPKSKILMSKK